jgi:hypothetical protein
MDRLVYALPLLACPIGMSLMMWFMMRGKKNTQPPATATPTLSTNDADITRLQAQIDQLKSAQRADRP